MQNPTIGTELGNRCFKIRLANSSIPVGKSGGFRIITYYVDDQNIIQQENISDRELSEVLRNNGL